MQIYLVGGAVRDQLLGLPVLEKDYVVVGASSEEMLALGYRQVGKDFPVFLHPKTQEEYALARRERKTGKGYTGFVMEASANVTLEDDLLRRDLTINAIAQSITGELIDPFHGKRDIEKKILRHVSPAFVEDPVRILRAARFSARFAYLGFTVADETVALMQEMVKQGEVDALVPERVWKEFERALTEKSPEQFLLVLAACDALEKLFPHIAIGDDGYESFLRSCQLSPDPEIRFAALVSTLAPTEIESLCDHYKIPNSFREIARLTEKTSITTVNFSADEVLKIFIAADAFRREARFHKWLVVLRAMQVPAKLIQQLERSLRLVKELDTATILAGVQESKDKAAAIQAARLAAIKKSFLAN